MLCSAGWLVYEGAEAVCSLHVFQPGGWVRMGMERLCMHCVALNVDVKQVVP